MFYMSRFHMCVRLCDGAASWMDVHPAVGRMSPFSVGDVRIQSCAAVWQSCAVIKDETDHLNQKC